MINKIIDEIYTTLKTQRKITFSDAYYPYVDYVANYFKQSKKYKVRETADRKSVTIAKRWWVK